MYIFIKFSVTYKMTNENNSINNIKKKVKIIPEIFIQIILLN